MKFSMEAETLVRLGRRSESESEDLAALVRQLGDAAEPLAGTFNGPAKAAFNSFKARTDEIATALNNALTGIVGSISGQNQAFVTAAGEGTAAHSRADCQVPGFVKASFVVRRWWSPVDDRGYGTDQPT